MKKLFVCFAIILSQMLGFNVSAEECLTVDSELNPEYLSYIESVSLSETEEAEYVPPMISLVAPAELGTAELPEKYDSREYNRIFDSKLGQKSDQTCWTFVSCLAAETAIKDGLGTFSNLSEQHLKYSASSENGNPYGYEKEVNSGGNFKMFEAYASSWRGLVKEEDDPYVYGGAARDWETVTSQKPVSFHMTETVNIPNVASTAKDVTDEQRAAHVNEIKTYVKRYGCCFSSMYWDSKYINRTTNAYFNKSAGDASNHAIAIIGWDDNYSKTNFNDEPKNNGAFIVKNSQGDTGYVMYMSYEDMYAGWESSCVAKVDAADDYDKIYNYNNFEPSASFKFNGGETVAMTTAFISEFNGEYVSAVGAYTVSKNVNYKVYISKTASGNEKSEEKYTQVAAGTFEMPGLHTVKLDTPYELGDKGTVFCVRIVYDCDSDYDIPIERNISGAVSINKVAYKNGQCFINSTDMGEKYNANAYIKAFTDYDSAVSNVVCNKNDSGFEFSLDVDFVKSGTVIAAGFKENKLVGIRVIPFTSFDTGVSCEVNCSDVPEYVKFMAWDSVSALSTRFDEIKIEF